MPTRRRIQACLSDACISSLETYAKEHGYSVSRAVEELLLSHPELGGGSSTPPRRENEGELTRMVELLKLMKQAKEANLI